MHIYVYKCIYIGKQLSDPFEKHKHGSDRKNSKEGGSQQVSHHNLALEKYLLNLTKME